MKHPGGGGGGREKEREITVSNATDFHTNLMELPKHPVSKNSQWAHVTEPMDLVHISQSLTPIHDGQ